MHFEQLIQNLSTLLFVLSDASADPKCFKDIQVTFVYIDFPNGHMVQIAAMMRKDLIL